MILFCSPGLAVGYYKQMVVNTDTAHRHAIFPGKTVPSLAAFLDPDLGFTNIKSRYKYHQYAKILAFFLKFLHYSMSISV